MQENKKSLKLQKIGTIALLCLLVVAFVGSIFCAMVLPFANVNGVASAVSNSGGQYRQIIAPMFAQKDLGISFADETVVMTGVYGLFINPYFDINDFAFPVISDVSEGYPSLSVLDITTDSSVNPPRKIKIDLRNFGAYLNALFSNFGLSPITFSGDVFALSLTNCIDFDTFPDDNNRLGYMLIKCNDVDKQKLLTLTIDGVGSFYDFLGMLGFYPTFSSCPLTYLASSNFASTGSFTLNSFNKDVVLSLSNFVSLTGREFQIGSISQGDYDTVVNERDEWKQMYDKLVNDMGFSTFNSVDLVSTKPDSISVGGMPILSSRATTANYNNVNYGGYWYYRSNVENAGSNRAYLCELDVGSTLIANSDIKLTYNAIFPYNLATPDNIVVVLGLSNFGANSNASNYKEHIIIIKKEDFVNGSIVVNVPFDVNYIAFELCTYDSSSGALDKLDLSMPNVTEGKYQGIFISNFVVSGRGANFNTVIDNANKQGYNKGYQDGKTAGYDVGFQAGVKDNGDYTFMGLLGSVFDAPISAFRGLFNFEILGTNMQGFVLALLTLSVIVVIIKIALGGR